MSGVNVRSAHHNQVLRCGPCHAGSAASPHGRRGVVRGDGVQREPQQARLDHRVIGERPVQVGRIEPREPVPQGDVRRGRLLGLGRDDPADALDDRQRLSLEQQLSRQRDVAWLPGRQFHQRNARCMTRMDAACRGR